MIDEEHEQASKSSMIRVAAPEPGARRVMAALARSPGGDAKLLGQPIEHDAQDTTSLMHEFLRKNMTANMDQIRVCWREGHSVNYGGSTVFCMLALFEVS